MTAYHATFNDGKTAARHDVRVRFEGKGLRIEGVDGLSLAYWPFDELEDLGETFEDDPLRLTLTSDPDARLTFPDSSLLPHLLEFAPALTPVPRSWDERLLRWSVMAVLAVAVLAGVLVYGLPRFAELATRLVPVSWEVALGEAMRDQVDDLLGKFSDSDRPAECTRALGRASLDRLATRLTASAESPYEFQVTVLNQEVVNAFALPGGQIVLFQGLLEFVESPEELAGILAHEIGHVTERHVTEKIIESAGLAFFFGVMLGDVGSGGAALAGETLVDLAFSRGLEAEADDKALQVLADSGISAKGLGDFFKRLRGLDLGISPVFEMLSTHPSHDARAEKIAAAGNAGGPAMNEKDWWALRDICDSGSRHP